MVQIHSSRPLNMKISPLTSTHISQITTLVDQLGYPAKLSTIKKRFQTLNKLKNHKLLIAIDGDQLLGWIHLEIVHAILYDTRVEIRALVVDQSARRSGVGKKLVLMAKQWAKKKKIKTIYLRTNIKRKGAHKFYEHIGFSKTKTSYKYEIAV